MGNNSPNVIYPETYPLNAPAGRLDNRLSSQLKLIARLLSGGSKTKIFLARIGGFDTHAGQVESYDPTMGGHAALLHHISSAVFAFQEDLRQLGLDHRVLTLTTSEFGRRAVSNGSFGTDHGNAAPMFLFGRGVKPGIIGTNPDLNSLDNNNIPMQIDYRQVFTTVLQDWMGATDEAINFTMFGAFLDQKLDLIVNLVTGTNDSFIEERFGLDTGYPNPVSSTTTFTYYINKSMEVKLDLYSTEGRLVQTLVNARNNAGLQKSKNRPFSFGSRHLRLSSASRTSESFKKIDKNKLKVIWTGYDKAKTHHIIPAYVTGDISSFSPVRT